ncbi:hypothetical protein G2W53_026404 [Senna tora]|uniref:Uncharacterized protein n=1 Tax=Senna tora TaxID=362788 RepID=A0A834TNX4_9FABA|nr:hypothetical protein G2W53_026404 [Senna tora]
MPPSTDFEIALLNYVGCAPSMMMPNSWMLVGGFEALCNFHKEEATVEAFFYFFQMNFPQKGSWFYFQARDRGPHAKKLFQDLRDPPKDWKKDFFLVRPRKGCQPAWWLREDGTPLFPTMWVEPFEAIPRPVLRTSFADTQKTVRVLSALPSGLDIDYYFITDENGGKFNPARVLSLVKREEAKHGKNRSGSSSAHQPRPQGGSRDEEPKKGHGKGHSSHSGGKGKASVSSGSKTSGLSGHKRRHEKDAELRSPSPKRAKVPAHAPESGAKDGSGLPASSAPATAATEKQIVKRCEKGVQKEKALLAAKKELEQLRPEVASLHSSEQLLKVQLESAQKELKVLRIIILSWENMKVCCRSSRDQQREHPTGGCPGGREGDCESSHERLHRCHGMGMEQLSRTSALFQSAGRSRAPPHELAPRNDMMEGTPSEVLILEPSPLSPSAPMSEKAIVEEASPGTGVQVAEGAKEREELSGPDLVGAQELPETPQVKPAAEEPGATESKPAATSEEFANSILAD